MSNYTPINKGQFTLEPPERAAEFERKRGHGCEAAYAENRRLWSEYPAKQFVADFPLHVDIELASVCNLRCQMCYTITDEFKQRVNAKLMDYDLFTRIVDQCAEGGVYSIRLSLRGESFLHKRFLDCVRYAKAKGILEVSTLTNGVRLDEALFSELMDAGLDWITISVDGIGEVYDRIRKPSTFERIVEKIAAFKRLKTIAGRVKPVIKVQTVFPAIAADPKAYYDAFAPITDMVSSNPLIDYLRNDPEHDLLYHEDFVCPQLFQRLTIGADGLVMLCANDEIGEYILGDAKQATLHALWHGERLAKARELHAAHRGHREIEPCRKCYLPRRTEPQTVEVSGRKITVENYVNRSQVIGA